jgi:hypothetical protein
MDRRLHGQEVDFAPRAVDDDLEGRLGTGDDGRIAVPEGGDPNDTGGSVDADAIPVAADGAALPARRAV